MATAHAVAEAKGDSGQRSGGIVADSYFAVTGPAIGTRRRSYIQLGWRVGALLL